MRLILIFIVSIFSFSASASEIKYRVADIPKELLSGADVVKRMEKSEFIIKKSGSTVWKRQYALTILNENGDSYSGVEIFYDQLRKVSSIDGALYNENGMLLKTLKNKDIKDESASSSMNLMDDSRVKIHNFYYKNYPYTIEYTIEIAYDNSFIFPSWTPQDNDRYSVEQSTYQISFPSDLPIRYKEYNIPKPPVKSSAGDQTTITWQINNVKAFKVPFAMFTWRQIAPMVYTAPTYFEISGYKGNMETWDGLGKFQLALNEGKDQLPEAMIEKVTELTTGISDKRKKIEALYSYFQNQTRYISIQLGLGGWQPFEAGYVYKNGYGDCKALTNYMHSLLKSAGIDSYYSLINAGGSASAKVRLIEDFPSMQFNHVILCVPLDKDSIWLECTSQELPAGYLSDFTANRKALVITPQGSKLMPTPVYGLNQNERLSTIQARLDEEGQLKFDYLTIYRGVEQDELSQNIRNVSEQKIGEKLSKNLPLPSYFVNSFSYKQNNSELPNLEEKMNISAANYATISGKRIFIVPNIMNRGGYQFTKDSTRKVDIEFKYSFRNKDDITIEIPDGYEIESKPKDMNLKTNYGTYSVSTSLVGNKLVYHRLFEQFSGNYPASEQDVVIAFYNIIYKTDRSRVVLVKKE